MGLAYFTAGGVWDELVRRRIKDIANANVAGVNSMFGQLKIRRNM
jgi:hypothetical protein